MSENNSIVWIQNFIDSRFSAPRDGSYIDSYDPSTGTVIVKVPDSSEDDVNDAVKAAVTAFKTSADNLMS